MMDTTSDSATLPYGLPHVAVVLLWYPLFTQPFIFREVETLASLIPLEVYTLYGLNLRKCSREMIAAKERPYRYGAKSVFSLCANAIFSFFSRRRLVWRLFKESIFHKWPNLETFGENLWGFLVGLSLGKKFAEDGIDLVYAPWPRGAATAARVGAIIAGIPFTICARGDNLEPADPDLFFKLSGATAIRANNAADRERIHAFLGSMDPGISLVYNSLTLPVSPIRRRVPEEGAPLKLLALGRFDVTKGFEILLAACAILKKRGLDFQLTLAGGGGKAMGLGHMGKQLMDLRHRLELESVVRMPGLISHDQLPEILLSHHIFVAPCIIHKSGRRDGIPNTVIEALAYGMPIVSTTVNALPEVVKDGETGFAVPPSDPDALAEAIIRLAENPELGERMGRNAAALASRMFDPVENALRLKSLFQDVWRKSGKAPPCAA